VAEAAATWAAQATDERTGSQTDGQYLCVKPPALGNVDKTFL